MLQAWPASAIHDTVAAIARQRVYARSIGTSLLDRLMRWLGELYDRLVHAVTAMPHGRAIGSALVVLLAVAIAARAAYRARMGDVARGPRPGARRARTTPDPWADAQRLAAEGRHAEAAHALYRVLLATLARRERLRIDPAKTSGDYARELRSRGSPAYARFRQFGRRYDRVLFGHAPCDAAAYETLLADAMPLLREESAA